MSTVISFKRILSTLKYTGFLAVLAGCFQTLALEVHFLRHGETAWNRAKVLQGSIPYTELTARGVRMAEETARGMAAAGIRYDRIYASHLRRAYRTAEIVAKAQGMKPIVDARLREMGMGKYEGTQGLGKLRREVACSCIKVRLEYCCESCGRICLSDRT